jgi:predicted flap endonuclease-1-like 5' DNA nuclease
MQEETPKGRESEEKKPRDIIWDKEFEKDEYTDIFGVGAVLSGEGKVKKN